LGYRYFLLPLQRIGATPCGRRVIS
jgi:hypothetical protein